MDRVVLLALYPLEVSLGCDNHMYADSHIVGLMAIFYLVHDAVMSSCTLYTVITISQDRSIYL